jgi:hypothetical protein
MGLLDKDSGAALALLGSGLLGGNFAGGLAAASQYAGGIKQRQMEEQFAQMKMQEAQMRMQEMQREQALQQQMQNAARSAMITPEKANSLSMGPLRDGSTPPMVAPGFNTKAFLGQMYEIDPLKAIGLEQSLNQTKAPIKLGAGETLLDPSTYKTIASAPKEQSLPAAIQEYQYAQGQGYRGTFEQWDKERKRAGASNISVPINMGQKGLDNELKIRSDFRSEPIYKAHGEVQSAFSQISQALKQQSPAGDMAGATKIMKLLDPGSVVRESELGMAMAATGLLDRATNYAQMVMSGQKLTPKQREDFQNLANVLYAESAKQYNQKRNEYAGFATDYGLNADRIVGPAVTSPKLPQVAPAAAAGGPSIDDLLKKYGR